MTRKVFTKLLALFVILLVFQTAVMEFVFRGLVERSAGTTFHPTSTCMMGQHRTAVVDADTTRISCAHGTVPSDEEVRAMALWAAAPVAAPVGADDLEGRGDPTPGVAAAELVRAGVVLVVGRATPVFRTRERQWIAIMAELADHGWRELA